MTKTRFELGALTACAAAALSIVGVTSAFPLQDAVAAAGAEASAPADAAVEALRATFIDINGNVQWRPNEQSPWKPAMLNDVVEAGAEIRSGIRSRAALRVGRNATVLVDAGTNLTIPTMMQEGETLKTTAAVKAGRADFKVDRVGLTNDFRVVTPSTTLAVKGTEFAVMIGPLKQMEIVGARRNVINAIELRYALNNRTVNLSGAAQSSSATKNPAHLAMLNAAPPKVAATPKLTEAEELKDAAHGAAPVESGSTSNSAAGNKASLRTDSQEGDVEASVSATIRRSIALANERTDRAIEYMLHAAQGADVAAAQADVLASLRSLADARRNEALASLTAHQAALDSARAGVNSAIVAQDAFNAYAGALAGHLNAFQAEHQNAHDLLSRIEDVMQNQSEGDLRVLAQQAADALTGMNTSLEGAQGSYQNIAAQLALVNEVLAGVHQQRPEAAAAIAAYQAAMAQLQQLAASGASAGQIATAAQGAVANLQALISQLAGLAYTHEALAAASQALDALARANQSLAQSQAALDAIRAARDAMVAGGNAAQLGMVEQLYQQIVAIRTAMANNLLASAGLIDAAEGVAGQTNSYAEGVFTLLGNYWNDAATVASADAHLAAGEAGVAASQAQEAYGEFQSAVAGAEGVLADAHANYDLVAEAGAGVTQAHGAVDGAAAHAMTALGNVLAGGHPAMTNALMALDALEQALGGILAQYGNFQSIAGQQPAGGDISGFQAQGAAALQALLDAIANAQQASANAAAGAATANDAADAAAAVRDLALQLAERFGLDMDGALAAAAQAYAEALASNGAAGSAANAAQQAQALALLAQADAIGNIAAQIDALLAQTGNLSEIAQAELAAAQASYVGVNEFGTTVFAELTVGEANGAFGLMQSTQPSMASLQEMAATSTAYVAALDGAENAAKGAETAEVGARKERRNAENHASYASTNFNRMNDAINTSNFASAVHYGNETFTGAGNSGAAADRSQGHAQEAVGYYQIAQQHGHTAESLQAIIHTYGTNSAQYQAAAAALAGNINNANANVQEISARADFYNDVAQMLAGRANTDPARAAALQSADAHTQVLAIAAQLAESAQGAAQLEQTARSNAERMFYRSARQYVERAGGAAQRALEESRKAREAADHAAELARKAAEQAALMSNSQTKAAP